MNDPGMIFAAAVLSGVAAADDIDDWVDRWHESGSGRPLHEALGFSPGQYARWMERPDELGAILDEIRSAAGGN